MDVRVAILTFDIIDKMGAGIVVHTLHFMTPVTGHSFSHDLGSSGRMLVDVCDVPVATVTRVGSVNRSGKLHLIDTLVAFKAR
jgi:hypothetical protein